MAMVLLLAFAGNAKAVDAPVATCASRITMLPGDWRMAEPSEDRPVIAARGDYDEDGRQDVALLLRPGSGQGKFAIAVCLSGGPEGPPMLIENAYTTGPISTRRKGTRYFDFDTERYGVYERDGIGSYCCDCCGATYILRDGKFVEVVDND